MTTTQHTSNAEFIRWALRAARGERSQAKFAADLGISRMSLINYEQGKRIPDAILLLRVLDMLRGHPIRDAFLGGQLPKQLHGGLAPLAHLGFDAAGFPTNAPIWGMQGCDAPAPDQDNPPADQVAHEQSACTQPGHPTGLRPASAPKNEGRQ